MTKELKNLVSLLKSPIKENRDLGIILAQNYEEEFKAHFGYDATLMTFLAQAKKWHSDIPLNEIEELKFQCKDISSIPEDISLLKNLTCLGFVRTSFSIFPTEVLQLSHLKTLCLFHNRIKILPPEIGQLQELNLLVLGSNQLQNISPEIGKLQKLRTLRLENNQLQSLPKELVQIKTLKRILIQGNPKNIIIPKELRHIIDVGRGLL